MNSIGERSGAPVSTTGRRAVLIGAAVGAVGLAATLAAPPASAARLGYNYPFTRDPAEGPVPQIAYNDGFLSTAGGRVRPHQGIDFNSPNGSVNGIPVHAIRGGTIVSIQLDSGKNTQLGNVVQIRHDDGNVSLYAHMQAGSIPSDFVVGKAVAASTVLGRIGSTGTATTGPHLHLGMFPAFGAAPFDPAPYVDGAPSATKTPATTPAPAPTPVPTVVNEPAGVRLSNGTQNVFWNNAGVLEHNWNTGPGWQPATTGVGTNVGGVPAPLATGASTMDVFYRGKDGRLRHNYFTGVWSGDQLVRDVQVAEGSRLSVIARTGSSTENVYFRGPDDKLYEAWFNGVWNHHQLVTAGTIGGDPVAINTPGGGIDVFYRATDGTLHHTWSDPSVPWQPGSQISPWKIAGAISAVSRTGNSTENVFWRAPDGALNQAWFNGTWTYNALTGQNKLRNDPVAVTIPGTQGIDVFFVGTGSAGGWAQHIWYLPSSGAWSPVETLPGNANVIGRMSATATGTDENVFWRGEDGSLQQAYFTGTWNKAPIAG